MKWNTMGLFPSPLIKIELDSHEKLKQFFYDVVADKTKHKAGLTHFHSGANVFELYPELDWFKVELLEAGTFAYQNLLNHRKSGDMEITNAWFNLCDEGGVQPSHSHANCLLSGTYYVNADEHSQIEFYHPLTTNSLHAELFDEPENRVNEHGLAFHKREVVVSVANGDCLFWPSQMKHGYKKNKTPARLSLSFNMMPTVFNSTYQIN